jgi:anti-anti-sigma factor
MDMTPTTAFEVVATEVPHGLRLIGELDLLTAPQLQAALDGGEHRKGMTLDLAGLSFIDSTGLHLIARYAESMNGNGPLRIVNVPRNILQVIRITRFHDHPQIAIEPPE